MTYYHHHTTEKVIQFNLYGKGKIDCQLKEYFGHHGKNSDYQYLYKQEITEIL
jgi:hypothetical protein